MQTKLLKPRTRHQQCVRDVRVGRLFGANVHITHDNVSITCNRAGVFAAIVWQRYGNVVVRTAHVRRGRETVLHEVRRYEA